MSSSVLLVKDSVGTGLVNLAADGDGKLGVVDSEAIVAVQDVDSSVQAVDVSVQGVTTTLGLVDSSVQSVDSSVQAVDSSIGTMSAKLPAALGQTTSSASMAVVIASDQSSIPVTTSASSLSTTSSTVFNAQVIADGATTASSSVDLDAVRDAITVFGHTTNTTDSIGLQISHDGATWRDYSGIYVNPDFLSGGFAVTLDLGARYLRINKSNSSGSSETITAYISYKI